MRKPLITKETTLGEGLREKMEDLLSVCRKAGDMGVDYPLDEENTIHYLLWDAKEPESSLAGALAYLPLCDESAECIAYVRPDMRRKGCFSQFLLAKVSDDFPETDFIFPVREPDPDTTLALMNTGAEPDGREYLMELTLDSIPAPTFKKEPEATDPAPDTLPDTCNYPSDDAPIGSCHLERTSKDSVCLYGVEIKPDMRHQGYGYKMILSLIDVLKSCGISRVCLHVGADNIPAVSLYEKAGFRTTETLSFYLF